MVNMKDIYFDENYGKLYEKCENGEAQIFRCATKNGVIINQFIKRKIPLKIAGTIYYDIITPYGYGGPYIEECYNKDLLLKDYEKQFYKYCIQNNIVAEFVRFHPICKNYYDFKDIYNATFNRYTLGTDLKKYNDPIQSELSKHTRKIIKSIINSGVTFKMIENPTIKDIKEFQRIYYLNMKRKGANEYYFFDDEYFENILKFYSGKFVIAESIYEEKVIAVGLYFITNNTIHAHLSGTDTKYLYLSPAYILKYGTVLWGKKKGYDLIHYGGGTSSSLDDPLYMFKLKFSKNTKLEFWIGKKIWNEYIYDDLCINTNVNKDEDYFPAYRKILH